MISLAEDTGVALEVPDWSNRLISWSFSARGLRSVRIGGFADDWFVMMF